MPDENRGEVVVHSYSYTNIRNCINGTTGTLIINSAHGTKLSISGIFSVGVSLLAGWHTPNLHLMNKEPGLWYSGRHGNNY